MPKKYEKQNNVLQIGNIQIYISISGKEMLTSIVTIGPLLSFPTQVKRCSRRYNKGFCLILSKKCQIFKLGSEKEEALEI